MNPELIYKYLENTATDAETEQVLDWLRICANWTSWTK